MKYLVLFLFLVGCSAHKNPDNAGETNDNLKYLHQKITQAKNVIKQQCSGYANNIKSIAEIRDQGMEKWRMKIALIKIAQQQDADDDENTLTTNKVLGMLIATELIYNKPHIPADNLYDIFYHDCIVPEFEELDKVYIDLKKKIS